MTLILHPIKVWAFTCLHTDIKMFPFKPLNHSFNMLEVIVILKGDPPFQSQFSGRRNKFLVNLSDFLISSLLNTKA